MESKLCLKKLLPVEFGCHYMTEFALQLHLIERITTIDLPLVPSCFLRPFIQLLNWSGFSFVEYDEQDITWLRWQRPSSNIQNTAVVHSSLIVAGNENLKYFFYYCSNIPTVRS